MSAGATRGCTAMSERSNRLTTKRSFIGHRLTWIIEKTFEFRFGRKRCSRAKCTAFHRRDGVAKRQTRLDIFAGEKPVEKPSVKCIAGAGRVSATAGRR